MNEESLFHRAMDLPAAERAAFLDEACAGDTALRQRLEQLLQAHTQPGSFLQERAVTLPAEAPSAASQPAEAVGTRIGPYKLIEPIGEGGMGSVWLAEQQEPVRRHVALKLIKEGLDSARVIARFEAERQALALMDHPNIAKVFDAGTTDAGRPYFVMELVKGVAITRYCDEQRLTPRQRLELFIPVCQAVQHAHQKGIIHRDLKPSNVLVTLYDGQPVPKVIDFGIAKATNQQLTEKTLHTGFGAIIGTLEYLSPEQAEPNQLDIDTRSDVYALGVMLYELLTGSTPLDRKRLQEAAIWELLRVIREEEPPRPSMRLSSGESLTALSAQRQMEPVQLARLVRGELDWIVMKALEKDRQRRYDTANSLAEDVGRYLRDEPVQACPPSTGYRLRKFVQRHRGPVLAAGALLLVLLLGMAGTSLGLLEARQQRDVADEASQEAEKQRREAVKQRDFARTEQANALAHSHRAENAKQDADDARKLTEQQLARSDRLLYNLQIREANRLFDKGELDACQRSLIECRWDLHGPEFGFLQKQSRSSKRSLKEITGLVYPLLLNNADTLLVAVNLRERVLSVHDRATGKVVHTLGGYSSAVHSLAVSRDDKHVFSGHASAIIHQWDLGTGKVSQTFGEGSASEQIRSLATSTDGKCLFSAGLNGNLKMWDIGTGREMRSLLKDHGPVYCVVVSPHGQHLYSAGADETVKVWDAATGAALRTIQSRAGMVMSLSISQDSRHLFCGTQRGVIWVWDLDTERVTCTLRGHTAAINQLVLSGNARRLFSGSEDGTIKLWDLETASELLTLRNQPEYSHGKTQMALSRDGKQLLTVQDDTVKVWDLQPERYRLLRGHDGDIRSLALDSPGKRLYSSSRGLIKIWDLTTGEEFRSVLDLPNVEPRSLTLSADRKQLYATSGPNIKLWDVATGKEIHVWQGDEQEVTQLALRTDGTQLLSVGSDSTIKVWDVATRRLLRALHGQEHRIYSVSSLVLSPDDRHLFAADVNGRILVWDLATGQQLHTLPGHGDGPVSLAVSVDGRRLFSGGRDRTIKVWDTQTWQALQTLRGHRASVYSLAVSRDGKHLYSGDANPPYDNIKVWKLEHGMAPLPALVDPGPIHCMVLSADCTQLITCGTRRTITVWDVRGSAAP